jgi:hypothetical protein
MAAIAVVAEVAPLASLVVTKFQAEQPLATNVLVPAPNGCEPVTVDWHLVTGWRSAVERLEMMLRACCSTCDDDHSGALRNSRRGKSGECRATSNFRQRAAVQFLRAARTFREN